MTMLPRYVGRGKTWFWDELMRQLRNVDDPHDFINPTSTAYILHPPSISPIDAPMDLFLFFESGHTSEPIDRIPTPVQGPGSGIWEVFTPEPERKTVYIIVVTDSYIPYVPKVFTDKDQALAYAKDEYASEWNNAETKESGCIYFNQEEDGNMENSISVIEAEIE